MGRLIDEEGLPVFDEEGDNSDYISLNKHVVRAVEEPKTSPSHYSRWKIQPITFIEINKLPYWCGNVIKYVMRYDAKNGVEDLKKARQYLDWKIAELEDRPSWGE